jgi:uncharacterized protein YjbJ (UPF0337 family)
MNWERIEGNWEHYRGNAKRHWLKLTDEQLDLTWGKRGELAAKIEHAYGISRDQAEKQLASWQGAQKY